MSMLIELLCFWSRNIGILAVCLTTFLSFQAKSAPILLSRRSMRMCLVPNAVPLTVASSLDVLKQYDTEYLKRERSARREGKTIQTVELERAQTMGGKALKQERESLKAVATVIREASSEVVLGIKAETGSRAVQTLQSWVAGLQLPRSTLLTIDENDDPVEPIELENAAVYIKYNSSDSGAAYMKPYKGGNVGVIFQVKIAGDEDSFYQFGDLPLALFPSSTLHRGNFTFN